MFFYLGQFILLVFILYCYSRSKDRYLGFCLKVICFFIIFLPAALRLGIGTDYKNYVDIFQNIQRGGHDSTEKGWQILNKVCIVLGLTPQYLFIFSSFITYFFIFKTVKKDTIVVLLVYYLFLYSPSYNLIRNCLGLSFVWYGYYLIIYNKRKEGIIWSLVAGLFHSSCLLYFPVFLISFYWKIKKKIAIFLFIILYLIFMYVNIAELIFSLPILNSYRWSAYLFSDKYGVKTSLGLGVFIRHIFLFLSYLLCDENKVSNEEFSIMSWLFLVLSIADFLSCQIVIFFRVHIVMYLAYIAMYKVLFMSNLGERNVYKLCTRYLCYLYVVLFVFIISLINHENGIIPYMHIELEDLL